MTTPHPHLNSAESLARIRAFFQQWEMGEDSQISMARVEAEFLSLDRYLCNGGALPGDWRGHHERAPKNLAEKVQAERIRSSQAQPAYGTQAAFFKVETDLEDGSNGFKVHYYNEKMVYLYTNYDLPPEGWRVEPGIVMPVSILSRMSAGKPVAIISTGQTVSVPRPGEIAVDYGHGECCPHVYHIVDEKTGLWERRGQTLPQPGNPAHSREEPPTA